MEGPSARADGRKPFKPQTVLLALEPRRGTRRHPPQAGSSAEDFRGEHQKFYILGGDASKPSGFQDAASGFVGIEVAPMPAILNHQAQMAWPTADAESRPRHMH